MENNSSGEIICRISLYLITLLWVIKRLSKKKGSKMLFVLNFSSICGWTFKFLCLLETQSQPIFFWNRSYLSNARPFNLALFLWSCFWLTAGNLSQNKLDISLLLVELKQSHTILLAFGLHQLFISSRRATSQTRRCSLFVFYLKWLFCLKS